MHGSRHNLAALAIGLCLAAVSGCAQTVENVADLFSREPKSEYVSHVKTPDDRIKEYKELAKKAKKKTSTEQQEVVTRLCQELQNESEPLLRRHILRTLAVYPQDEAAAAIVGALSDHDLETRRAACRFLGERGGPDAVRELTRVISSDTDLDVRLAAVRAMGHTKETTALAPLAEALADADPAMQALAQESLTAVSGHHFGDNVQAWREYAATGKSDAPEVSLAERIRRSIY